VRVVIDMVSVSIHHPKVKSIDKWIRKNGDIYYSIKLIDDGDIDIFVDDIDEFIAQLTTLKTVELIENKCST
jgi:hypothetical protein